MVPTDREFGRLEQKVDDLGRRMDGVEGGIVHLREAASAEHAAMARKIDAAVTEIQVALERRDRRLDSFEADRNRRIGRDGFIKGAFGALIALLGVLGFHGFGS